MERIEGFFFSRIDSFFPCITPIDGIFFYYFFSREFCRFDLRMNFEVTLFLILRPSFNMRADSVLASFFPFSKKEWIFDQVLAEINISFEVFVF
jgi:hypothetical protein